MKWRKVIPFSDFGIVRSFGGSTLRLSFAKIHLINLALLICCYKQVTPILCPLLGQVICPEVGGSSELSGERTTVSAQEPNSQTPLKSILVISGGEGYIDFRMGKNFNFQKKNYYYYCYIKYYYILVIESNNYIKYQISEYFLFHFHF